VAHPAIPLSEPRVGASAPDATNRYLS
jgi:hypothetical protein